MCSFSTLYLLTLVPISVSQVGNDQAAIDYLSSLDEDKTIGDHIDVTSNVQHEMSQVIDGLQSGSANIPPHLKPLIQEEIDPNSPLWTTLFRVKRLVGAVHPWYDQSDEATGKKKRSFFSSKEAEYKAHWSEDRESLACLLSTIGS